MGGRAFSATWPYHLCVSRIGVPLVIQLAQRECRHVMFKAGKFLLRFDAQTDEFSTSLNESRGRRTIDYVLSAGGEPIDRRFDRIPYEGPKRFSITSKPG